MTSWANVVGSSEMEGLQGKRIDTTSEGAINRKKFIYLISNMPGCIVHVRTRSGKEYEGVFHKAFPNNGNFDLILKQVANLKASKGKKISSPMYQNEVKISGEDLSFIKVKQPIFAAAATGNNGNSNTFKTDTQISNKKFETRNLVRWKSDEPASEEGNMSLDEQIQMEKGHTEWDQFKQIESSTYDLSLYTTEIDRNSEFYKKNVADATRLAKEINSGKHNNTSPNKNISEEQLFSTVARKVTNNNAYKIPQKQDKKETEKATTTTTTTETESDKPKEKKKLSIAAKEFVPSFEPKPAVASIPQQQQQPQMHIQPQMISMQPNIPYNNYGQFMQPNPYMMMMPPPQQQAGYLPQYQYNLQQQQY